MGSPPLSRSIVDCFVSETPGCKQNARAHNGCQFKMAATRSLFMIPFYSASSMKLKSYISKYYVSSMIYMKLGQFIVNNVWL